MADSNSEREGVSVGDTSNLGLNTTRLETTRYLLSLRFYLTKAA